MNHVNQEKQGLRTQEEWYNPEIEMSAYQQLVGGLEHFYFP